MIKYIKEENNEGKLIGCEIGVWMGDNALNILNNLNISKLYLVDPYKQHRIYNGRLFRQRRMDMIRKSCMERLKQYNDKIVFIYEKSRMASRQIPDESLDFVYIDGSHRYKDIKNDIRFWYSKVKLLGLFGGHDYNPGVTDGVCRAVDEFNNVKGKRLFVDDTDWWMVR